MSNDLGGGRENEALRCCGRVKARAREARAIVQSTRIDCWESRRTSQDTEVN